MDVYNIHQSINIDCVVGDIRKNCRTCLKEGDLDNISSIFDEIVEDDLAIQITQMIKFLTNIEIIETDKNLPQVICSICVEKLWSAYSFKLQVERIDNIINGIDDNSEDLEFNNEYDQFTIQNKSDIELGSFFNKDVPKPIDSLDSEVDKILNMVQKEVEKGVSSAEIVDKKVIDSLEKKVNQPKLISPDVLKKNDIGSPLLDCGDDDNNSHGNTIVLDGESDDEHNDVYKYGNEKIVVNKISSNLMEVDDNHDDYIVSDYEDSPENDNPSDDDQAPEECLELSEKLLKDESLEIKKPPERVPDSILQNQSKLEPHKKPTIIQDIVPVNNLDRHSGHTNQIELSLQRNAKPKIGPTFLDAQVEKYTKPTINSTLIKNNDMKNIPVTSSINNRKLIIASNELTLKSVDPVSLAPPQPTVSLLNDIEEDMDSCESLIPTYKIEIMPNTKTQIIRPNSNIQLNTVETECKIETGKGIEILEDIQYHDFFNSQLVVLLKNCKSTHPSETIIQTNKIINLPVSSPVSVPTTVFIQSAITKPSTNIQSITSKPTSSKQEQQSIYSQAPVTITRPSPVVNHQIITSTTPPKINSSAIQIDSIATQKSATTSEATALSTTLVNKTTSLTCNICGTPSTNNVKYLQHLFNAHTVRSDQYICVMNSCKMCKEKFEFAESRLHKCIFINSTPEFICTFCDRNFLTQNALTLHEQSHATSKKTYSCDLCKKRFISPMRYKNHMDTEHVPVTPASCDVCGMDFSSTAKLDSHKLSHKKFQCIHCAMSFDRVIDLNSHARTHVQEEGYKCDVCGKMFSKLKSLKLHEYIHTSQRQYSCDICKKDFKHYNSLRFHIRSNHQNKTK